jgi:hypothetical protein
VKTGRKSIDNGKAYFKQAMISFVGCGQSLSLLDAGLPAAEPEGERANSILLAVRQQQKEHRLFHVEV